MFATPALGTLAVRVVTRQTLVGPNAVDIDHCLTLKRVKRRKSGKHCKGRKYLYFRPFSRVAFIVVVFTFNFNSCDISSIVPKLRNEMTSVKELANHA